MKHLMVFFWLIGLLSPICSAQDLEWKQLNNYLDTLEAHNKLMGSLAVSKNGTIVFARTIGMADVELNLKAVENSKYRIGSISKTFTAVLVFKAVEQGLIGLDQTIAKHFPTIENSDKITVEHLLYHRSGIYNFTSNEAYLSWHTQKKTQDELVEIIATGGSDFEPGSQMAYSNSNYVLLTILLEKCFEKSYADLLAEYITRPLGLQNTYVGGAIDPHGNECRSYLFSEKWTLAPESDMS
ncbi:MAG: beta-lactamase family protein, partial [Bacteroidales bacterium]|nr:beta-lactamase family protein [Bacteroidales bacterium]